MSLVWMASVLRPQAVLGSTSDDAIVEPWNELAEQVMGRSWRRQMRQQNRWAGERTSTPPVLDPLLEAHYESINAETLQAGVSALRQIVLEEDHADRGRLTAAVLLTCSAAAELDDYRTCDAVLDLADELSADDRAPDARLLRAALLQQRALRNRDTGRSYLKLIEAAIDELDDFEPELCEPFETTTPNESATSTLEHIRLALLDAANSLIPFRHRRNTQMSRVRPDQLRHLDAMKGESHAGALARNYAFHATGTPSNQANILGPADPFFVALGFELLGHHGVYAARKELAQTRFVDLQTLGQADVDEVPRLLRQSGSKRDLDLALNWLAANGPLEVLLADARQILAQRADPFALRTLELRVLRSSAELLSSEEKQVGRDAIDRLLDAGGPFDLPGEHEIAVLRVEQAWLALASLADTPQSIDRVSQRLLTEALAAEPDDELLDRALAAALGKLDWDVIRDGYSAGWRAWLDSSEGPRRRVRRVVENGLKSLTRIEEPHPLSHLAERVDRVILGLTDEIAFGPDDIDLVRQSMRATRERAARGVNAMGGIPESDVAAALITRAGVTELWPDLTNFLIDPVVLPEHKSAAFNRLAASGVSLPDATRIALTAHAQTLLEPTERPSFGPSIRPFPPALRLLAIADCIPHRQVVAAISALMQNQEAPARREAAITANSILRWSGDPWLLGFVLHMSFDRDARVRAYAGQGLVNGLSVSSTWYELAVDRVQALLTADGVTSVIAVLAAFKEAQSRVPTPLLPTLEALASNHISGSVRKEARALVAKQDRYR